jgi:defect-in-organelle-trafficking protein DotC
MPVDTIPLADLESGRFPASAEVRTGKPTDSPRLLAIKEAATSLGARTGLVTRANAILGDLEAEAVTLDRTFAFQFLRLNGSVQPPVIVEARDAVTQADDRVLNITDRVYRIEVQAKLPTVPTTWRDYLYRGLTVNGKPVAWPDAVLQPQNDAERQIWRDAVRIGWTSGTEQADGIFALNLARLERDFNGMLLYHELRRKGMVSDPIVADASFGVTGDADKQMNIGERVYRITVTPAFNMDSRKWQARTR